MLMLCRRRRRRYLDAMDSTHFSRYFNHRYPDFNLNFTVDRETNSVNFYARRAIDPGEELTFDYGMAYWSGSGVVPLGDSRNYTAPERPRPESLGPRPVTPTTPQELASALALPKEERRASLLRCLEYFGGVRLPCDEDGDRDGAPARMRVPFGLGPAAPTEDVDVAGGPLAVLEAAATACVQQAADAAQAQAEGPAVGAAEGAAGGAAAEGTAEEAAASSGLEEAEVQLWRRFISKCPRFATDRLNAAACTVLLLWTFPESHGVTSPMPTEEWEALLSCIRAAEDDGDVEALLADLEQYAPRPRIDELMAAARRIVA